MRSTTPALPTLFPKPLPHCENWDGKDTPDEAAYAALGQGFQDKSRKDNTAAFVGKRLNYEISGVRSKVIASVNKAAGNLGSALQGADDRCRQDVGRQADLVEDQAIGQRLHRLLCAALARSRAPSRRQHAPVPKSQAVYLTVLWRTFLISSLVTLITLCSGLSRGLHAGPCAGAPCQHPVDFHPRAVLDVAPGSHHRLVRLACRTMADK